MAISRGYAKYADDRTPAVIEMIADTDTEAKKGWHEVRRIDANGVEKSYLFGPESYAAYEKIAERHDAELRAWMAGGGE